MAKRNTYGQQQRTDDFGEPKFEDQNSFLIDGLKDKVTGLKSLALDMGDEIKYQNKFLNDLDRDFERSSGFLGNSLRRVQKIAMSGNNRQIFYLALFALIVFFLVYVMIRFR